MLPERKRDMATFNRIYSLYSDRYESSLEKRYEWGLVLMPSYKTKQMRKNVALTEIHQKQMNRRAQIRHVSKPLTLYEAGGFSFMQSWLNWYSIGPENRHSARISGFESQALRLAPLAQLVEHLTFNQRVGSSRSTLRSGRRKAEVPRTSCALRGTYMHEWRSWYTHLTQDQTQKCMWVRIPPRVLFNVFEKGKDNGRFRD